MLGDTCVVCGNTQANDKSVSMHCNAQDKAKRQRWIEALGLQDFVIIIFPILMYKMTHNLHLVSDLHHQKEAVDWKG